MVGILSNSVMDEESKVCKEQNSNIPQSRARVSERLRLKKRRKELAFKAKVVENHARAIELTQVPIQHGNPAHKILFLTRLGLTPKSGVQLPPYLQLDRLSNADVHAYKNSSGSSSEESGELETSETHTSDTDQSSSDIDEEDLDLELVISPVDIPEFFEEIYKKKPKKSRKTSKSSNPAPTSFPKRIPVARMPNNNKCKNSIKLKQPFISTRPARPVVAQPLYRQVFQRVANQNHNSNQKLSGPIKMLRSNLRTLRQIQIGGVGYTAQVVYDAKLDNIRQRLLHYNTVLEYVE